MYHRTICLILLVCSIVCIPRPQAAASNLMSSGEDFSPLLDYIAQEDLQDPLLLFEDHAGDFDRALNRENIAFLNQNKDLLQRIKDRLKGDSLQWKLSASSKRRLIVPEQRPEYAALFQRYCRESIDFLLDRLHAASPYTDIATLQDPQSLDKSGSGEGVTAFLVHNIADEYIEEYVFFNQEDDSTQIKIKLRNRVFSGKIGAYSSDLVIGEDHTFEFTREPFTLWQNSAENPLNVFIAPIEETLHILLRGTTESAIRAHLAQDQPSTVGEVEAVIQEWMAVEEAIVGGLVARLMPEIFARFLPAAGDQKLREALAQRDRHAQYRYLTRGIQVVVDLGLEEAVNLYKSDPLHFRDLVRQPDMASVS